MPYSGRRRDFIKASGAAGILGLSGCIGGLTGGSRSIKVGVLLPLSGGLSFLGGPWRDAATLPIKLLEGADVGPSFDVQVEDTQTNPQAANSGAQALVDGGYPAVNGPAASEALIQVANNVYVPNEVVACSPTSTAPRVTNLDDNDFVFRTAASDALLGQVLARVAEEQVNASTMSILHLNDAYGQSQMEAFRDNYGGEVLETISFQAEQQSYSSKVAQAMADDPDGLLVVCFPESGRVLLRDYYANYGYDTDILASEGLRSPELPSDVGQQLTNVTGVTSVAAGPSVDFFTQEYQNEYGSEPVQFASHTFDSTASLVLANAAAGENTGSAVRDSLRSVTNPGGETITADRLADGVEMAANGDDINYEGASTAVTFDDNGDVASVVYRIFTYTEGGSIELGETITLGG